MKIIGEKPYEEKGIVVNHGYRLNSLQYHLRSAPLLSAGDCKEAYGMF